MTQTARDVVYAALAMTNILIAGVAPTKVQATRALDRLNDMMHAWKTQGVDVGHIDLALSDDFALAPEHILGTKALLCALLCGDYEVEIPPSVAAMASAGWSGLQAAYIIFDKDHDAGVETALRAPGVLLWNGYPIA